MHGRKGVDLDRATLFCGEVEALGFPIDTFRDVFCVRVVRLKINKIEKIRFSQQNE